MNAFFQGSDKHRRAPQASTRTLPWVAVSSSSAALMLKVPEPIHATRLRDYGRAYFLSTGQETVAVPGSCPPPCFVHNVT